jgi:glycosyltransferase involved in cell wall biosynthesis
MPKVTIIIPFCGRQEVLKNAIESVINQSFTDWELILVDDCNSFTLNFFLSDKRIRLIKNPNNLGPGGARQTGLDTCSGDFVCFLDSDDIYKPSFLERCLGQFNNNNQLSFVYCISEWIDKKSNHGGVYKKSNQRYTSIMPTLLLENRPWHTSSIMWNRKYLPKWSEKFRTWEDYLFEFEASMINNKIEQVNESLCLIFRDENEGLSLLAEKSVGISHRSHVLQIMLNKLQNRDVILRNEIIRRLIKDTVKCINNNVLRTTYTRSFLVLRSYSFLGNIFPIRTHYFIFSVLLKNNFWRRVCIKLRIW